MILSLLVLFLSSYHASSCSPLTQKEYLAQDSETINPDHLKEFLFLVKHKAFYKGQIHFLGSYLNDAQAEGLVQEIRMMGWNATRCKVLVLEAERAFDLVSHDGKYGLCRILKTNDSDDNVINYRSVINLRSDPYTKHEMYAVPPSAGYWIYFCGGSWFINVIKLDMNLFTSKEEREV